MFLLNSTISLVMKTSLMLIRHNAHWIPEYQVRQEHHFAVVAVDVVVD
jgi:hypothetical protein